MKNRFLQKYIQLVNQWSESGGWNNKNNTLGKYIDDFYQCVSDFHSLYIKHWNKKDEEQLSRIKNDYSMQPIAGIIRMIKIVQKS